MLLHLCCVCANVCVPVVCCIACVLSGLHLGKNLRVRLYESKGGATL